MVAHEGVSLWARRPTAAAEPARRKILSAFLPLCRKAAPLPPCVNPEFSLKAARQARDQARALLAQKTDPGEQRKADGAEAERRAMESAVNFEMLPASGTRKRRSTFSPPTVGRGFNA